MEDQPKDRAQDRRHQHRGDDRSSAPHAACVRHDQGHFQRQHPEAYAKKTGSRKVNGGEEDSEKSPHLCELLSKPHPPASNGNRHIGGGALKQKAAAKMHAGAPRAGGSKRNMDLKQDKEKNPDLNHLEAPPPDRKEAVLLQNGVHCGVITNGYCGRDEGSGSEGGASTPKRRRARCPETKNGEGPREREGPLEPGPPPPDPAERAPSTRLAHKVEVAPATRRGAAPEAPPAECARKNCEGRAAMAGGGKKAEERQRAKPSSPSREDSWMLLKPPPVFPVDNSSAKIVPKISYASKVKENLTKAAPLAEAPPPVRLSQVPMSAMKTITSASFTNGPVPGGGGPPPTFFAPAASAGPLAPGGQNVASLDGDRGPAPGPLGTEPPELRKCTLFIYPLNMQGVLPSARPDPAPPSACRALGDIFHNQWGLSFINEPGPGAEAEGAPAAEAAPRNPSPSGPGPDAQDADRTCGVGKESRGPCSPAPGARPGPGPGAAPQNSAPVLFGSQEPPLLSKDWAPMCSRGSFDVQAAVSYHTKEMEYIFTLQKQDPNRVVVYDEAKDGPEQ